MNRRAWIAAFLHLPGLALFEGYCPGRKLLTLNAIALGATILAICLVGLVSGDWRAMIGTWAVGHFIWGVWLALKIQTNSNNAPEVLTDERLHDVVLDPVAARLYADELRMRLNGATDPKKRVSLLGEAGVWLRRLGDLDQAEKTLQEALRIVRDEQLGIEREIQQRIRLAHVYQWQRRFEESNPEFREIVAVCESSVPRYLPFAWQHAGKNFFDQGRYAEAAQAFETALRLRRERGAPQDQIESSEAALRRVRELLAR